MGFVRGRPFGYSPESVHHPSRAIGKLVGKPPLRAKWSVRSSGEPLKICNPVISPVGRFLIGNVSRPGVVESLNGSKPRTMAIATLIGGIATVVLKTASLFGGHQCAVHHVLGPPGCGLHPIHQLSRGIAPFGILLR